MSRDYYANEFIEEEPIGLRAGIQIRGLTKEYCKDRLAVNNIYLNMYEGQITALLGHNGAGKSTTMSMLTGLFPPTSGTAIVNGHDIRTDIRGETRFVGCFASRNYTLLSFLLAGVRGSLGLCPQHDVLFDELTVEEHLDFFCKLKGYPSHLVRAETDRMVKALQLENKRNAPSFTLSGGMKRKLSVGIALCGESKVTFQPSLCGALSKALLLRWLCLMSPPQEWILLPDDLRGTSYNRRKTEERYC